MIRRIAGRPGINWSGFDPSNPKHQKGVRAKLTEFLLKPSLVRDDMRKARVSEFTTKDMTGDMFNAQNVVDVIQTDVADIDLGWQAAFDVVDLRQTNKGAFDVMDVSSGLTFSKVKPGDRAKIYGISGSKTTVNMDLYGGGLAFDRTWWDDQDYYKVEEATADFRFKFFDEQAEIFYALLASSTNAIAFDTNDQTTLSNAIADLLNDLHKTLPVSPGTEFLIYFNPVLQKRIFAALNAVVAYTGEKQVRFSARPIMSPYLTTTTAYWVVLPGRKNKFGNRMDLQVWGETDIYRYAEDLVGWGRYGGMVNTDQIRQCALS